MIKLTTKLTEFKTDLTDELCKRLNAFNEAAPGYWLQTCTKTQYENAFGEWCRSKRKKIPS